MPPGRVRGRLVVDPVEPRPLDVPGGRPQREPFCDSFPSALSDPAMVPDGALR